jgi:hypothetical protein
MKPSAIRIERMLEKIEATLVSRPRPRLSITIHEGDDQAAAMEKALAEHVARHPEDVGHTVQACVWVVWKIVHRAQFVEDTDKDTDASETLR